VSADLLALLAAISFALGTTLQQRGTLATSAKEGDPHFLLEIVHKPVWLAGGALQACGWVLQAVALDKGSLIAVQAICTLSLVFALPLGARLTDQHVGRRAIVGASCALVGIVGFLAFGQPQTGTTQPSPASCAWALIVVGALLLLAWLARRQRGPVAAALFATAAGISFGLQAAVTKVFVTQVGNGLEAILTTPTTYVLIISALVGFGLQQSALKTGFLAPTMAASNASTLATSVLLGALLFDETISSSGHLPGAILGLALAVFGVVVLASPDRCPAASVSQ
jgi:drug/metabolite transporter (DMT)-like permease